MGQIRITVILFLFATLFFSSKGFAQAKAVFAAGCFWCIQPPYDQLKSQGVVRTRVGYAGGLKPNPSYEEVSSGKSGHIEVIEVEYDPKKISYEKLLEVFWVNIDPYDGSGQFCDKGPQYVSAVFYGDDSQKKAYEASLKKLIETKKLKQPVQTRLLRLEKFYPAEEYHQDYYLKNPIRYKYYRSRCGRDQRLKEVWTESKVLKD